MTAEQCAALAKYSMVRVKVGERWVPAMVNQPTKDGTSVAVWTQASSTGAFVVSRNASGGASTWAGRGRPVAITTNALWIAAGRPSGSRTRVAYFVTGRTTSSWSWMSWSRPRSLPIPARFTWPASSSTGDEHAYAVARPEAGRCRTRRSGWRSRSASVATGRPSS